MSLWIKICGNTSLEDALLAVEAGADAVGFVFAASPRRVTVEQVAAIVPHLPASIEKIGVFVDAGLEEIVAVVQGCGLTGVQLHFAATPELHAQLRVRLGAGGADSARGALWRGGGGGCRGTSQRHKCRCGARGFAHGGGSWWHWCDFRLERGR